MGNISQINIDGTTYNIKDPNSVKEIATSGSGSFLTGVNQSGGKLTFSKGNPSISASDLNFGIIKYGPEDSKRVLIPYVCNDIAFLTQRGGSATITKNGVIQNINLSKVFDGTTDHIHISNVVPSDVFVIELTLHKVFPYGSNVYLNSKSSAFRAKSIKLEVINTNYANDTWETIADVTNNELDYWIYNWVSHDAVGSGNTDGRDGFNKIRFTLTNANNSALRIGEIGVYGYQSSGMAETLVSRGGSEMFGDLTPYTSGTLHLGTSSKPWLETYTNYLHTDYINGEAVAMYRSEKRNTATSGTVTLNPNEFTSITPSANVTIALGSFSDSANYICGYHCIVNNSGNKTVTLPSGVTWMNGTPTIESGTVIEMHFLRDNSTVYGAWADPSKVGGGGDTNVIETVKVNGTALTPDANKAVDIKGIVTRTDVTGTSVTQALTPNVFYSFGTMTSLTVTLGSVVSGANNLYSFEFSSGSTATTLTLPNTVIWQDTVTIEANTHYEISIKYSPKDEMYYGMISSWVIPLQGNALQLDGVTWTAGGTYESYPTFEDTFGTVKQIGSGYNPDDLSDFKIYDEDMTEMPYSSRVLYKHNGNLHLSWGSQEINISTASNPTSYTVLTSGGSLN